MDDSKFKSRFTDVQLLDSACELIAELQQKGRKPSQREFDAAAVAVPTDLPRADSICSRLGISWQKLIQLPSRNPNGRAISIGRVGTYEKDADWVSDEQIRFAMRLIAHRLNLATITAADYRRERARLLRAAGPRVLPSEEQILAATAGWKAALALADLEIDPWIERDIERTNRTHSALDAALDAHGVIPNYYELKQFVRANGLALTRELHPYSEVIASWVAMREANGLETPEYEPRATDRPDFSERVIDGNERIRRGYWTEELAIAAVKRFLDTRQPGEPTTRKAYVDWSKRDRDAPSASYIDRKLGGFARLRRKAILIA